VIGVLSKIGVFKLDFIKMSAIIHSSMEVPEEYIKKFDKYETLINKQVYHMGMPLHSLLLIRLIVIWKLSYQRSTLLMNTML